MFRCTKCGKMIDGKYIFGTCPYCGYSRSRTVEYDEDDCCPECGSEDFDGFCYSCGYPDNWGCL